MPTLESEFAALKDLREALIECPQLGGLSDERFDQTHELFERSSDQQGQILSWLKKRVAALDASVDPLRILSVGCGSGILDNPLITTLAGRSQRVVYTGVDPNAVACRRFREDFNAIGIANVKLELREGTIETTHFPDRFDLIHAVHCLYYFSDPAASVSRLLKLLKPGGQLVVIQAPKAELNQLADCFWTQATDSPIWYSDRLERHLAEHELQFSRHRIDGWVDVTRCFKAGCPRGEMLLDFITQTDCSRLDDGCVELCLDYLQTVSRSEGDRDLVAHPVDVLEISAPPHVPVHC